MIPESCLGRLFSLLSHLLLPPSIFCVLPDGVTVLPSKFSPYNSSLEICQLLTAHNLCHCCPSLQLSLLGHSQREGHICPAMVRDASKDSGHQSKQQAGWLLSLIKAEKEASCEGRTQESGCSQIPHLEGCPWGCLSQDWWQQRRPSSRDTGEFSRMTGSLGFGSYQVRGVAQKLLVDLEGLSWDWAWGWVASAGVPWGV